LLRTLLEEVTVTVHREQYQAHMKLCWRGGKLTECERRSKCSLLTSNVSSKLTACGCVGRQVRMTSSRWRQRLKTCVEWSRGSCLEIDEVGCRVLSQRSACSDKIHIFGNKASAEARIASPSPTHQNKILSTQIGVKQPLDKRWGLYFGQLSIPGAFVLQELT
jgi:hypothetical protein